MKMGSEVFYDIKVVNFSHSLHILLAPPPPARLFKQRGFPHLPHHKTKKRLYGAFQRVV